jgi:hypothetical protein
MMAVVTAQCIQRRMARDAIRCYLESAIKTGEPIPAGGLAIQQVDAFISEMKQQEMKQ